MSGDGLLMRRKMVNGNKRKEMPQNQGVLSFKRSSKKNSTRFGYKKSGEQNIN